MKYLALLLSILIYSSIKSQSYVDATVGVDSIFKLIKEYRLENGLDSSISIIFNPVGSNELIHKTRYQSKGKFVGHDVDPNNSWVKCDSSAYELVRSLGYSTIGHRSGEVAYSQSTASCIMPMNEDSVLAYINSMEYAKGVVNGWINSTGHNAILLDNHESLNDIYDSINAKIPKSKFKVNLEKFKHYLRGEIYIEQLPMKHVKAVYVISIASSSHLNNHIDEDCIGFNINTTCVITAISIR